jgi:acyl-coenzyme A thioesterase PaaI-like protein
MTTDFQALADGLTAAVPLVKTFGMEYDEITTQRAVVRLPDRADLHNHVGGPHAGVMFALGETASGAVVLANFMDVMDRVTPLAAAADIRYLAVAKGEVTATATIDADRKQVLAELDEGTTPKFVVTVTISDESGTQTGEMNVRWALRPNSR